MHALVADRLLALYLLDADAADALARLPWVADGIADMEASEVDTLLSLAETDVSTAHMLVALPWVADGVTEVERKTLQSLALAVTDADSVAFARLVFGLSWVRDDVTVAEQQAIGALFDLRAADAAMAQRVKDFPWMADGVTRFEQQVLQSFAAAASAGGTAFARLVADLSWTSDDITLAEQRTIQALFDLRAVDAAMAQRVTNFPWVTDGITDAEQRTVHLLAQLGEIDEPTAQLVVTLPWVADRLSTVEMSALDGLHRILARDRTAAQRLIASSWLTDDVTYEELRAVEVVSQLANVDAITAQHVAVFSWLGNELNDAEQHVINSIVHIAKVDVATAQLVTAFPWLADGITAPERWTVAQLGHIVGLDKSIARKLASLPWIVDDMTDAEWKTVYYALAQLTEMDRELAQRVAGLPWINDDITHMERGVIAALSNTDRETAKAWLDRIGDNFRAEEAALVVTLGRLQHVSGGLLYHDLLQSHFIQSRTVSLPLAGDVTLWVIQTVPPSDDEDLTVMMEEVVRASEEFMGIAFPVTDVIMAVPIIGGGKDHGLQGEAWWDELITVTRYPPDAINRDDIHHVIAHYYFKFGPPWLTQGGADLMGLYASDRVGPLDLQDQLSAAWEEVRRNCLDQGISTIQQLNERQIEDRYFATRCHYSIGVYFLLNLRETLGQEVLSAALRALYLQNQGPIRLPCVTEEEFTRHEKAIYQSLLNNTPPELVDAFHEVYDRLHGGPRPD